MGIRLSYGYTNYILYLNKVSINKKKGIHVKLWGKSLLKLSVSVKCVTNSMSVSFVFRDSLIYHIWHTNCLKCCISITVNWWSWLKWLFKFLSIQVYAASRQPSKRINSVTVICRGVALQMRKRFVRKLFRKSLKCLEIRSTGWKILFIQHSLKQKPIFSYVYITKCLA